MPNNKVEKLCKKKKKWHWEKVRDTEIPSILSEMLERHEISRRLTYLLPHYWCSLKRIISNVVAPEVFTYSIHSFRNNLNQNEFGANQILILVKSFVYSLIDVAVVLIHCVLEFPCRVPCNLCNLVSRVCLGAQAWKHICRHFWCISLQDCLSSEWWW